MTLSAAALLLLKTCVVGLAIIGASVCVGALVGLGLRRWSHR